MLYQLSTVAITQYRANLGPSVALSTQVFTTIIGLPFQRFYCQPYIEIWYHLRFSVDKLTFSARRILCIRLTSRVNHNVRVVLYCDSFACVSTRCNGGLFISKSKSQYCCHLASHAYRLLIVFICHTTFRYSTYNTLVTVEALVPVYCNVVLYEYCLIYILGIHN